MIAVHTSNLNTAIEVSNALRAGTVWVNQYNMLHWTLPFGGYKESGIGRELGEAALDNYLRKRQSHILDTLQSTNRYHRNQDCVYQTRRCSLRLECRQDSVTKMRMLYVLRQSKLGYGDAGLVFRHGVRIDIFMSKLTWVLFRYFIDCVCL